MPNPPPRSRSLRIRCKKDCRRESIVYHTRRVAGVSVRGNVCAQVAIIHARRRLKAVVFVWPKRIFGYVLFYVSGYVPRVYYLCRNTMRRFTPGTYCIFEIEHETATILSRFFRRSYRLYTRSGLYIHINYTRVIYLNDTEAFRIYIYPYVGVRYFDFSRIFIVRYKYYD